jgi:hypothetical protein
MPAAASALRLTKLTALTDILNNNVTKELTRNKPTRTKLTRTKSPAKTSVRKALSLAESYDSGFDPDWYLAQYPDVALAGVSPMHHFTRHGRAEGRLPRALEAVELDTLLWSGSREAFDRLIALMTSRSKTPVSRLESSYAGWFVARWYAAMGQWEWALKAIELSVAEPVLRPGVHTPDLLYVDSLSLNGKVNLAKGHIAKAFRETKHNDWIFATANLQGRSVLSKLEIANLFYLREGIAPITLIPEASRTAFDALSSEAEPQVSAKRLPLISVLMPVFNAGKTLDTALRSILSQTWTNIEVLLVNDASTDASAKVIKVWARKDKRIKAINMPRNQGAYAARNAALARSRGDFITVHDSDDWSHPQKLELQAQALMANKSLKASVSHWIRATEDLTFGGWQYPPNWVSWCHRNTSSLMFRRSVFKELGYWDRVICSADAEYYHRLLKAYGEPAVMEVRPLVPLSFGRITAGSLTQSSETSIFTRISGLRWHYQQAYFSWHANVKTTKELYMPENPRSRPFPVEKRMLRRSKR